MKKSRGYLLIAIVVLLPHAQTAQEADTKLKKYLWGIEYAFVHSQGFANSSLFGLSFQYNSFQVSGGFSYGNNINPLYPTPEYPSESNYAKNNNYKGAYLNLEYNFLKNIPRFQLCGVLLNQYSTSYSEYGYSRYTHWGNEGYIVKSDIKRFDLTTGLRVGFNPIKKLTIGLGLMIRFYTSQFVEEDIHYFVGYMPGSPSDQYSSRSTTNSSFVESISPNFCIRYVIFSH
jgi:hypothetical protein